jgi:hypothetical protein
VTFRIDFAYHAIELPRALRAEPARLALRLQLHPHRHRGAARHRGRTLPRHRAQIEGRLKDAKLGHALRPLRRHQRQPRLDDRRHRRAEPVGDAVDLLPLAGASGTAPDKTPLRRHAKMLRRALRRVRARITRPRVKRSCASPPATATSTPLEATWAVAFALPPP